MTGETTLDEKVNRVEEIIEILEDGAVSLERAQELREEGDELLAELREDLDVGDGELLEQR